MSAIAHQRREDSPTLAGTPAAMVRVLDVDPALGTALGSAALERARPAAVALVVDLAPGPIQLGLLAAAADSCLGLLVLDGLVARHVEFEHLGASELLGPGDVLRPALGFRAQTETARTQWEALAPMRFAVLDRDFAYRVRHWPEITAALLDRTRQRVDTQLLQSAIRQVRRVEDRLLLALWNLAERWGEPTRDGRRLPPAKVSDEVQARIVGARRQSVSAAMRALIDRGLIEREPDGSLLLIGPPPALGAIRVQEPPLDLPPHRRGPDRRQGHGR